MLKCIIIDGQPQAVQSLKNHIKKVSFLDYAGSFPDSTSAMNSLKNKACDLIFLDAPKTLQPGNNYISIFQKYAMVILTSSNRRLALEGFEHDVVDFLLKPVLYERFNRAVEKAFKLKFPPGQSNHISYPAAIKGGFIFIKEATRLLRVELDDIYYVKGLKNYVSILTKSHRIVSLQTMKQMEELLPPHRFIRVHRSYFVAIDKIISVEKQQIHVKDKMIPVGSIYQTMFMKKLMKMNNP